MDATSGAVVVVVVASSNFHVSNQDNLFFLRCNVFGFPRILSYSLDQSLHRFLNGHIVDV